jgi:hypothetical protein
MSNIVNDPDWILDCNTWRGEVLTGKYSHWCPDWDFLPVDETCKEWPCSCADDIRKPIVEWKTSHDI